MKKLTLLIFILVLPLLLFSQSISVKSFRLLENDMSARIEHPKTDQNGEKAALIKVVTTQTGFEFDGGSLGIVGVEQKTAEIWVYVPRGAKAITIKHPKLGMLRNYAFPVAIVAASVYELELVSGTVETMVKPNEIETQWLIVTTEPSGADIYINDQAAGQTPYQNEIPVGKYSWRVSKELYLTDAGVVELTTETGKKKIDLKLKPNFGTLAVSSTPESGAIVTLNGIATGKTTPCNLEMVPTGEHTLSLRKDMFETTTRKVTLAAGQTQPVIVAMSPTFAEVSITTEQLADILINGQKKSNGTWKGRLTPGVYTFEAKLDKHTSAIQKQNVAVGTPLTLNLNPIPKTGAVKLISTPFDATVTLNGKDYGTTPNTIKNLLVGDYTLTIKKAGYGTVTRTVTVKENATEEVNETLLSELNVKLKADPIFNNTKYDRKEDKITIYYSMDGLKENQRCKVEVFASVDGGHTYSGPLKQLKGDFGSIIVNGNKTITWNPFDEIKNVGKSLDIKITGEVITIIPNLTLISYSFSPNAPYGLMVGRVSRWGYYARAKTNGSNTTNDYTYKNGIISDYTGTGYYEFDGTKKYSTYGVTIGALKRITNNFFLYAGAGYGSKTLLWKAAEFSYVTFEKTNEAWVKNSDKSYQGVEFELGGIVKYRWLILSFGVSSINAEEWDGAVGVGVAF